MIVDTSALLAFFDRSEPDHEPVAAALTSSTEPLVVSPYVVAELDYLVGSRLGVEVELRGAARLADGAWDLATLEADDLRTAAGIIDRYADQSIGVADASNVVLAHRYRTHTIVTLDRRHFEVIRPIAGGRFTIVP